MQREATALRVTRQLKRRVHQADRVLHAGGEVDRPASRRRPVASDVGSERAIAFAVEVAHHLVPAATGLREAVQEEERLGHPAIMPARPDTHLLLRAFADELARCGMREACTSPGSRSSPLVLALVREPRLRCFSHIDERCAGFFAVGAAKLSGRPVAIACTSGTAAANLAPAVIEACQARIPLVVLTADRPPELREVGAGQTIDQIDLYGSAAKWFFEVGTHEATPARMRWMRALACRAFWTSLDGRPGPVHLNFALREPLIPPDELGADPQPGRSGGRPWVLRSTPGEDAAAAGRALAVVARDAHRPVVVAGRSEPGLPEVAAACERLGWPLLADPLSGARRGGAAIAHYDALLRSAPSPHSAAPTSSCAAATCRRPSRCAPGWTGSARRRSRS